MSGEENSAAEPAPVIDVQGDGRWMSQVCVSVCVCVFVYKGSFMKDSTELCKSFPFL